MGDNVQSAIFEVLRKIQAKLTDHDRRFDEISQRMDELGVSMRKQRRDLAGILVVGKSLTDHFNEELAAVQERVRVLEARGG